MRASRKSKLNRLKIRPPFALTVIPCPISWDKDDDFVDDDFVASSSEGDGCGEPAYAASGDADG
jgi:hypothetical protein